MTRGPSTSFHAKPIEYQPLGSGIIALALLAGLNAAATMTMTATTALHLAWPNTLLQVLAVALAAAVIFAQARDVSRSRIAFALGVAGATVPALLIAAHHETNHWDDFMTWLANARYIWTYGGFPTAEAPPIASVWPGYPPGSSIVLAAIWSVAGRVVETAGPIINVASLMLLPRLVLRTVGNSWPQSPISQLAAGGALGIAATFLNPALDWHWVLSSLPDTATMIAFTAAFLLGAEVRFGRADAPRAHLAALAAILALLVNLKQTGLVLVVLLAVALVLVAWTWIEDERHWLRRPVVTLGLVCVPGLATWLCWEMYRTKIFPAKVFFLRPLAEWHFAAVPDLLFAILQALLEHWSYFLPVIAVLLRGLYVLGRRWLAGNRARVSPADRLAALFALVQGAYLAFLFVCYLGAFGLDEIERAAEFFRYQSHLGGAGMITALALIMERLPRPLPAATAPALLAAGIASAALILPAPGLYPGMAVYGAAEFKQLRETGRNAGRAIAHDGRPVTVQMLTNDDFLANLILRYEIWASAPRLVRDIVWTGIDDGDVMPERFAAAMRLAPHAIAITKQGTVHCLVHGSAGHAELTVSAADVPACRTFLGRIRAALDKAGGG